MCCCFLYYWFLSHSWTCLLEVFCCCCSFGCISFCVSLRSCKFFLSTLVEIQTKMISFILWSQQLLCLIVSCWVEPLSSVTFLYIVWHNVSASSHFLMVYIPYSWCCEFRLGLKFVYLYFLGEHWFSWLWQISEIQKSPRLRVCLETWWCALYSHVLVRIIMLSRTISVITQNLLCIYLP